MEHFGLDIFGASRRDAVQMVVVCFTDYPCLRHVTFDPVALYVLQKTIKTNFVIKLLFQKTRLSTLHLNISKPRIQKIFMAIMAQASASAKAL